MGNTIDMTDYMGLQQLFTDEERLVRETARDFVNEKVIPVIDGYAQKEEFPQELIPLMGELGFLGPTLPEEFGCAELSNVAYGLLMYELERGDSGIRSFASVQGSLVMYPIFAYGSAEQKRHWLPRMAKGEAIGCFGLTEPDFGSNPSGMKTRAVRNNDGTWTINGAKMWITNGSIADVAVVWAQTDEGVRGFLVDKGTDGFTAPRMKGKWSLRASVTSELVLENVVVEEEKSLLPKATGLKGPLSCLTQARYGIAWGALGAADNCYQTALEYAKSRIQFDKPIAAFQLQQRKLAEIARSMLGANGIMGEYPIMRHMNNLESVYTYEGTHDMHTLIIGQEVTGIAAYRG